MKTEITEYGQKFVDRPVVLKPKPASLAQAVSRAHGHPPVKPILIGYERVNLKWVKPSKGV